MVLVYKERKYFVFLLFIKFENKTVVVQMFLFMGQVE